MKSTLTEDDERLDATFSALANPTRRAILARLAEGEASVGELAQPFDLSMPAISRHLRVLQEAGLVRQGRRAQYRPCVLEPLPLAQAARWADQYRAIWEARFDRMESRLEAQGRAPGEQESGEQESSEQEPNE